jgi:hypothetical protein
LQGRADDTHAAGVDITLTNYQVHALEAAPAPSVPPIRQELLKKQEIFICANQSRVKCLPFDGDLPLLGITLIDTE